MLSSGFDLPFQEQIDFFRNKINLPTERWDDIWQAAHDRAFVVAGANKADLLADLKRAVDKAIAQGTSLDTFRTDFRQIITNHGWTGWTGEGSDAGFNWRTKVIWETNLRTSYAAGRWAQLNDPGLKKLMPYWRYVHADSVLHPRPLHLRWGQMRLTLPSDDPFWKTHFPPNGWGCRCRVTAVAAPKAGDAIEPPAGWDTPGEDGTLPGIDKGFGYAPGASNLNELRKLGQLKAGILPPELQRSLVDNVVERLDASESFSTGVPTGSAKPVAESPPPPTAGPAVKGSLWKHPGTGQERIYFNGLAPDGVKVFAVENSGLFEVRFHGAGLYGSEKDAVMDQIDRALEAWKGDRVTRWDDLKGLFTKPPKPLAPPPPPIATPIPPPVALPTAAKKAEGFSRVVDLFGNGNRVQYFNDAKGVFVESQKTPSGLVKWRAGEVVDNFDRWLSVDTFKSREEAEAAIRGLKISNALKDANAKKYGFIPKTWAGDEKKVVKALVDAGVDIERLASSTQSKSKYVYLENGMKVRLADHNLPGAYDAPDFDFRYGDNTKEFVADVLKKIAEIEKKS